MKLDTSLDQLFDAQADGDHSGIARLDCRFSVNAVTARFPSTLRVFNQFGIDLCCGSSLCIEDAARASGIDADTLCGALRGAMLA